MPLATKNKPASQRGVQAVEAIAIAASTSGRVDEVNAIIRGVKVLGHRSRNGRRYPREAMERALKLYEGAPVHLDHPGPERHHMAERSVRERWGELRNARLATDGAGEPEIRADLHYNPRKAETPELIYAIKHRMKLGLSHNSRVIERPAADGAVVEQITDLNGVDIVLRPATARSIFESEGGKPHLCPACQKAMAGGEGDEEPADDTEGAEDPGRDIPPGETIDGVTSTAPPYEDGEDQESGGESKSGEASAPEPPASGEPAPAAKPEAPEEPEDEIGGGPQGEAEEEPAAAADAEDGDVEGDTGERARAAMRRVLSEILRDDSLGDADKLARIRSLIDPPGSDGPASPADDPSPVAAGGPPPPADAPESAAAWLAARGLTAEAVGAEVVAALESMSGPQREEYRRLWPAYLRGEPLGRVATAMESAANPEAETQPLRTYAGL